MNFLPVGNSYTILESFVNYATNVITFLNPILSNQKTSYSMMNNPPSLGANDPSYNVVTNGAILKVFFIEANGGTLTTDTIYFMRPITSFSFSLHITRIDALNNINKINLSGFKGGKIGFLTNVYNQKQTKFYAVPKQCCPEIQPHFFGPFPTKCSVSFNGTLIDCLLEPSLGNWHSETVYRNSCYFVSYSSVNYSPSTGGSTYITAVARISNLGNKTSFQITFEIAAYSFNGINYQKQKTTFTKTNQNHADFSISGIVNGNLDGATSASYEFAQFGNFPSLMRLKLTNAKFSNGGGYSGIVDQFGINLTGPSIGDLDEILQFNQLTLCYESEQKNYFNIPGRLTIPIVFFHLDNSFKFTEGLYEWTDSQYGEFIYSYGYLDVFGRHCQPGTTRAIKKSIRCNSLNPLSQTGYFYFDSGDYLEQNTEIIVYYSFSSSVIYPSTTQFNKWDTRIEPFYKSEFFMVGSNNTNSFYSSYRLND